VKVARIPYLNAEPFYLGWGEDPPFEVVEMVPRELGRKARSGLIDAGLMAVADWFEVDGEFVPVSPFMGVAAREQVQSVILFAHDPPRRLARKRIGVTDESSTSRRLLELLARARWKIDGVTWVPESEIVGDPRETVDAMLLIGDRALELAMDADHGGWEKAIDLAAEWWSWQALPFVFAVWTVRAALPRRDRERFSGFLSGSLALGSERLAEIAADYAGLRADADALRTYLENLVYRLGPEEQEGLQRFRDLLADFDIQEYGAERV
jgi:chorismate dehydratase